MRQSKKRSSIVMLVLLCALALSCGLLSGCKTKPQTLVTPTNLTVNEGTKTLTWDIVANASGYFVQTNGDEPVTNDSTTYDLSKLIIPGTYEIKVMAKGNGKSFLDSEWSLPKNYIVHEKQTEGLRYRLTDGGLSYEVFAGAADMAGEVIIPSVHDGKPVTKIGIGAFSGSDKMTSISMPTSIVSIGDYAFRYCTALTSFTIPDGVTKIGPVAFDRCTSLAEITIPDSVTRVGSDAFLDTAWYDNQPDGIVYAGKVLYNYKGTMPENTTISNIRPDTIAIADYAFYYCFGLTNISIPDSVIVVGSGAFQNTEWFYSQPAGIIYIGKILYDYKGKMPKGAVIDDIRTDTISIADYAFAYYNELESITIPEGVTTVGDYAFSMCGGLKSVTISNSVTSIGNQVFEYCRSLEMITVASGNPVYKSASNCLIKIPENILIAGCQKSVIPKDVTAIGDYAFADFNELTDVIIPSGVTSIGNYAFYGCAGLNSITIPSEVISIGDYAFYSCARLKSFSVPSGLKSIGDYAFNYCRGLKSFAISSKVEHIGFEAFAGCLALEKIDVHSASLYYSSKDGILFDKDKTTIITYPAGKSGKQYDIPVGVTKIGGLAFSQNKTLTEITIPDGVTSIGYYAFCNSKLKAVSMPDSVTSINTGAFSGCEALTDVKISNHVVTMGDYVFNGCYKLTTIKIPDSVIKMGKNTFSYCEKLANVTLSKNLTSIEDGTFHGCDVLASLTIPESVTIIGGEAFYDCFALDNITIPADVKSIGHRAFYGCSSLKSITIPSGVTIIEDSTFMYCTDLENVTILGKVTSIGVFAFGNCDSLTSFVIPDTVTTIGELAFDCPALTSIVIPSSVTSIGRHAFYYCYDLTSVTIPSTVTVLGENAFYLATTVYAESLSEPSGWENWNEESGYTVVWGCVLSEDKSYVESFAKTENSIEISYLFVDAPYREGYTFGGWATSVGSTEMVYTAENITTAPDDTTLYAIWTKDLVD